MSASSAKLARSPAHAGEVFVVALGLGLGSFGGPVAHIGYFERAYVAKRQWLSAEDFTGLVALCQVIPGPTSSQLGYLIGLRRAGWAGGLAAWAGFTLPSALLMAGFALLAPGLSGPVALACLHGLKLAAVAVVAQAVVRMGKVLCPNLKTAAIAILAATALLVVNQPFMQILALVAGAVAGMLLCQKHMASPPAPMPPIRRRGIGALALGLFVVLLGLASLAGRQHSLLGLAALCYRAGALVFGGGHVVLPLLREALVPAGWLRDDAFLAGYGAAQAMPGPLFSFAAYLGAVVAPQGAGLATRALWSASAVLALFLPGGLIAVASLSVWNWLSHHRRAMAALSGINAAVVGVLGAALITPIGTSAVLSIADGAIALLAFILLDRARLPPIAVVGLCVAAAVVMRLIGHGP